MSDVFIEPLKYPNSDNILVYDYNRHRYVLTDDAIYTYLGINFGEIPAGMDSNPSSLAQRWANRVSDQVYRFLTKDSLNAPWLLFELATVPQLRDVVKEMLLDQAHYMAETGDVSSLSGIDAYKGVIAKREDINAARVSYGVEDIAYQIQPCIGRCLKYAGYFGECPPPYKDASGNLVW